MYMFVKKNIDLTIHLKKKPYKIIKHWSGASGSIIGRER